MRRYTLLLLLSSVLWLTGCSSGPADSGFPAPAAPEPGAGVLLRDGTSVRIGTFNLERAVVVVGEGSIAETRRFTATDQFAAYWREQLDNIRLAARQGWQLEARDEGNQMVITMTREYSSVAEFNQETGGSIEVIEHPLFRKMIFKQSLVFDPQALASELPAPEGVTEEEWTTFLAGQVRWSQQVTLPSRITSHNMDAAQGNTVQWARSAGKIKRQADLVAETRVYRPLPMAFAGLLGVLLIGGPIAVRATRRWWDAERE